MSCLSSCFVYLLIHMQKQTHICISDHRRSKFHVSPLPFSWNATDSEPAKEIPTDQSPAARGAKSDRDARLRLSNACRRQNRCIYINVYICLGGCENRRFDVRGVRCPQNHKRPFVFCMCLRSTRCFLLAMHP